MAQGVDNGGARKMSTGWANCPPDSSNRIRYARQRMNEPRSFHPIRRGKAGPSAISILNATVNTVLCATVPKGESPRAAASALAPYNL